MATLAELAALAAQCTRCPLAATRTNVVFGTGDEKAPLMFVGEAPGRDEDLSGLPFVGRSGKLLDELMASELGVTRDRCFIANTLKCRPPDNRDPQPLELDSCRPYLEGQLDLIGPKVVITLGNFATKLLLLGDPNAKEGITKLRGKTYPWRGITLVPTFHPAAALRSGGETLAGMRADFVRAKQALSDAGVAW